MTTVQETLYTATGEYATGIVEIHLAGVGGFRKTGYGPDGTIIQPQQVALDATGTYSVDLVPNADIDPANTVYAIKYYNSVRHINVPDSDQIQNVYDLLAHPPGSLPDLPRGEPGFETESLSEGVPVINKIATITASDYNALSETDPQTYYLVIADD